MAIKYISVILGTVFEIYCMNKFINIFSPRKEINKNNKYRYYIAFILISLFHILIPLFFKGVPIAIGLFITVFLFNQFYKSKQYVKMIISISVSVMYVSSELLFGGIFMLISNDTSIAINTTPEAYAIGTFLSKFLVFVIILIFEAKRQSITTSNLSTKYLILLSVLPITTVVLSVLMYQVILVIDSPGIKLTFVIANMLLILSNTITFEIIRKQNRLAKAEYELQLLKNNVDEQKKHYEEIRSSQEEIRKIRHDLKNTCLGAVAELKAGKTENAIEQLQYNIDIIEKSNKVIDTGHPSIDAIIENKINRCDDLCIHTDILYRYNEVININEIEIAVIVGNILDNAIEACQKVNDMNREIWGTIASDNQNIIIDIRNTAVDSNNFKTSKADRKSHGFGLNSISHIAKKYKGYAKFTFENNEFRSFVILDN